MVAARHAEMNAAASNGERLAGSRPDARRRSHPQSPLLSTRVDLVRTQASTAPHGSAGHFHPYETGRKCPKPNGLKPFGYVTAARVNGRSTSR